ncbi:hypothetical protein OH797_36115 [Streptomyces anulatus]|uniref:ATP-dependent DNA ligase n=1 Tax=Streptomyces TaxID=1883 RepID=UPI0027E2FDC2|nr:MULTISPECIES: hypothetical protein [Streptomyces]WTC67744.1 hypothetical protein OG865_36615 [Streptomyces anulatus]WUC91110.1 hypothetical protein OHQ35_35535 [Streptomyces anulatus]WUD93399.1 hypothetical protein OG703_36740 [Streptomyces anulatus]
MEYPIRPSLARAVPTPPTGPNWHFEVKVDGHRMILRRIEDGVICYSRTGRIVTSHWMDLAVPAMQQLLPGTTCDGEAVTWRGGRIDFGAVQARAASSLDRARALAARPYTERRAFLVEILADVGPCSSRSWPPPTAAPPSSGTRHSTRRASRGSSPSPAEMRTRSAAGPCGGLTAPSGEPA